MAGQSSQDVLQQTVDSFASRVSDYADGIAQRLGQPLSGQQLTKDEAVQRWNFSPLGSTAAADQRYHELVAQGTTPGQALQQVYPMRQLMLQGADINDAIARAKQIAGWAADAAGEPPPKPYEGSTMPQALQQQAAQLPPSPAPLPPMPMPGMPGLPSPLQAGPPPGNGLGPVPGLPLPVAPPAPGPLPMPPAQGPLPGPTPMPVPMPPVS